MARLRPRISVHPSVVMLPQFFCIHTKVLSSVPFADLPASDTIVILIFCERNCKQCIVIWYNKKQYLHSTAIVFPRLRHWAWYLGLRWKTWCWVVVEYKGYLMRTFGGCHSVGTVLYQANYQVRVRFKRCPTWNFGGCYHVGLVSFQANYYVDWTNWACWPCVVSS